LKDLIIDIFKKILLMNEKKSDELRKVNTDLKMFWHFKIFINFGDKKKKELKLRFHIDKREKNDISKI